MAKKKAPAKVSKELPFEEGIEQLEAIIERIETGEVGLEESLAEYEQGMTLIAHCKSVLDRCEQRVEDLTKQLAAAGDEEEPMQSQPAADEDLPI